MKRLMTFATILLLAGCASHSNNANGKVPAPDVLVEQTTDMPVAAEHVTGGMPVGLRITVTNKAPIPITLQRAEIASVGEGGYYIRPTRQTFGKVIAPDATDAVELWVPAIAGLSVVGVNGPVSLRVTTTFDSPQGAFTNTVLQQVGGNFH